VRLTNGDPGRMDMADHPASDLALPQEDFRVPIARDLLTGQRGLQEQRVVGIVGEGLGEHELAAGSGRKVP